MSGPIKEWLRSKGYTPYVEVPHGYGGRMVDIVGRHSDRSFIVIEMKTSLKEEVFRQALTGKYLTEDVYCAVPGNPRKASVEKCKKHGLGILLVWGSTVEEILAPGISERKGWSPMEWLIEKLHKRLDHMASSGIAGLPCIKGVGPAQTAAKLVLEYREQHPRATWKEIFKNVPNHYASPNSMASALRFKLVRLANKKRATTEKTG